jgi:hypothetical protein
MVSSPGVTFATRGREQAIIALRSLVRSCFGGKFARRNKFSSYGSNKFSSRFRAGRYRGPSVAGEKNALQNAKSRKSPI